MGPELLEIAREAGRVIGADQQQAKCLAQVGLVGDPIGDLDQTRDPAVSGRAAGRAEGDQRPMLAQIGVGDGPPGTTQVEFGQRDGRAQEDAVDAQRALRVTLELIAPLIADEEQANRGERHEQAGDQRA